MQTQSHTPDEFLDDPELDSKPAVVDRVYKTVTNGTDMDVHAMLIPKGKKVSLRPYTRERVIVLSMGMVSVKHSNQNNMFKGPAHFILPASELVEIVTLEDTVCYGIDQHEHQFVPLDEQASKLEHFFTDGVYARKIIVPAGTQVPSHKHAYDHLSILAQGRVRVSVGPITKEYVAPAMIEITKNLSHTISAVEDSVWFCIHATDATDIESLETSVIAKE